MDFNLSWLHFTLKHGIIWFFTGICLFLFSCSKQPKEPVVTTSEIEVDAGTSQKPEVTAPKTEADLGTSTAEPVVTETSIDAICTWFPNGLLETHLCEGKKYIRGFVECTNTYNTYPQEVWCEKPYAINSASSCFKNQIRVKKTCVLEDTQYQGPCQWRPFFPQLWTCNDKIYFQAKGALCRYSDKTTITHKNLFCSIEFEDSIEACLKDNSATTQQCRNQLGFPPSESL